MDMTKVTAAWTAVETWCKAHPLYVQYGVIFAAGFLVAKCVF